MSPDGYQGEYYRRIDEKGRVSIPTQFRDKGEGEFHITLGPDLCLRVYNTHEYAKQRELMRKLDDTIDSARAVKRLMLTCMFEKCDGVGRIMLTSDQTRQAQIRKEVAIVGMDDHFEIWAKDVWAAQRLQDMQSYRENYRNIPKMLRTWVEPSPLTMTPSASPPTAPTRESNEGA